MTKHSQLRPGRLIVDGSYGSDRRLVLAVQNVSGLVCVTEVGSVYSAVRTGSLNKAVCASAVKG